MKLMLFHHGVTEKEIPFLAPPTQRPLRWISHFLAFFRSLADSFVFVYLAAILEDVYEQWTINTDREMMEISIRDQRRHRQIYRTGNC
jgi:hypothetical protein